MKTINFTHEYNKLRKSTFTTIRGKTWAEKYSVGDEVDVTVKNEFWYRAEINNLELRSIKDILLEVLKKDVAPLKCESHDDFIQILNSFRRFNKLKSPDDLVCVITLNISMA